MACWKKKIWVTKGISPADGRKSCNESSLLKGGQLNTRFKKNNQRYKALVSRRPWKIFRLWVYKARISTNKKINGWLRQNGGQTHVY